MFLRRSIPGTGRPISRRRRDARYLRGRWPFDPIWLEGRVLLSGGLPASVLENAIAVPIGLSSFGGVTRGGADLYAITPSSDGRLIAWTHTDSASLGLRLSLFDAQGNLLVQSDGQAIGRPDPLIDQHLPAGTAYLEVRGLTGSGT